MRRVVLVLILALGAFLALGALQPDLFLRAEFARQRWMAGATTQATQVGAERIVHVQAGETGPILVLLHGFTGAKENWLPLMPHLADRYRVLAPDLPGWGESAREAGADYGYAAQAERLAAWLRQRGEGPVYVVGHSMGGGIAAILAARHPQLVSRLVLLDAGGAPFRENDFARRVLAGENPFAVQDRASLDRFLAIVFADPPFVPWPVDRALIARRQRDAGFERSVLDAVGLGPDAFLPVQEARRIVAPTLLLWCAEDQAIDVSAAEPYRAAIAGSRFATLQACNHMPMMERPAETAAVLKEFLP